MGRLRLFLPASTCCLKAYASLKDVGLGIGDNKDVSDIYHIEQTKIPNAINTIETIPVEVYKLERVDNEL